MQEQVSVSLGSDINYVYGTVNEVEATFSLTAPNTWSATVDKSMNGKYEISITAYNSLGTATTYNTVVYSLDVLITPKTDWTMYDVYNIEDLNRVEANIQKTIQELQWLCNTAAIGETKVDRTYLDLEFATSLNRIESNIQALKQQFYTPMGWIPTKTNWKALDNFSYVDANRLEINIKLLYDMIQAAKESIQYCGTIACGDNTRIF
ncbi:hypothetical protein [Clostridium sp. UBA1353]|uniref:hypothetical protein n=1 Tax=Clostridium sp. UBA1353 TaxID=1946347 RepID=UPI003216A141